MMDRLCNIQGDVHVRGPKINQKKNQKSNGDIKKFKITSRLDEHLHRDSLPPQPPTLTALTLARPARPARMTSPTPRARAARAALAPPQAPHTTNATSNRTRPPVRVMRLPPPQLSRKLLPRRRRRNGEDIAVRRARALHDREWEEGGHGAHLLERGGALRAHAATARHRGR